MNLTLVGYFGCGNLGDEAILQSVLSQLRTYPRPLQTVVLTQTPEATQKKFHVTSLKRKSFSSLLAAISMADVVIFAGGSLFQDHTSFRSLVYYVGVIFLARLYKKKIILYAQGFEPMRYKWSEWLLSNALIFCHVITVRDAESQQYLTKLLNGQKRVRYTVDSAIMLSPYQKNNLYQGYVGLNFMDIHPFPLDKIVQELKRFSESYHRKFLYIPFHKDDSRIGQQLKMALPESMMSILEPTDNVSEMLGTLKQMDVVVGCRLHSLILSAAVDVPFLGINFHDKVESFCKDVKQKYMRFEDLQKGSFYSNLVDVFENRKRYQNQLVLLVRELKERSKENLINNLLVKFETTS